MILKIHNHPQKQEYLSEDEWPYDSLQGHWKPSDAIVVPPPVDPMTGHLHVDMKFPRYAEFNTPWTIPFTFKLFHVAGRLTSIFGGILQGRQARDWFWDATGSSQEPVMIGDPMGLKQWSGHFTVDPDPAFPHGWLNITLTGLVEFENGDTMRVGALEPAFSTLDITKPVDYPPPMLASRITSHSPRRPEVLTGANQMDDPTMLPLLPFDQPWTFIVSPIQYGSQSTLPIATYELRADLDLHNGIPGRVLQRVVHPPDAVNSVLDPAILGKGPHKIALILIQPLDGLEEVTSLVVFDVVVGDVVPPETVVVPNVVGIPVEQAHVTLTSIGLSEMRTDVNSPEPVGIVVSQSPVEGTVLSKGSIVLLSVSKGNDPNHEDMRPAGQVFQLLVNGLPVNRFFVCPTSMNPNSPDECIELATIPGTHDH